MSADNPPPYLTQYPPLQSGEAEKKMPYPEPVAPKLPPPRQVILSTDLGTNSVRTICSECSHEILTNTEKKPSQTSQILGCFAIFCFGAFACCVPFCMDSDSCVDTKHNCPQCGNHVGTSPAQVC